MSEPRRGSAAILALACTAQFMVVLDVAIVNVALPSIQQDLGIGQASLQWIVIAYGLLLGGFLLLGGRLADLLGRRRILLAGLTLFSLASLLAGTAGSAGLLIGARALQGFGAAMIPPAALSIIAVTFAEGAARNKALGLYGAVTGVSASVGVIASGLITDSLGWRWIFFINVPIGAALVATAVRYLPADTARRAGQRFDPGGAVTVTGGLLLLVYALHRGTVAGWAAGSTIGLFAASLVLLAAFVVVEARSREPLVPAAVVLRRPLVAANLSALFTFGAVFAFIFLGSLLMQDFLGYSAARTGVAWLATTVASFVVAAITGTRLVALVGVRRLIVAGQSLLAVAALLLTRIPAHGHYATDLLPALLLAGTAGGLAAPAAQIGALSGVQPSMAGLASGLIETLREVGGAVGVALVATVLVSHVGTGNHAVHGAAAASGFHAAYWVIFVISVAGALTGAVLFPRRAARPAGPPTVEEPVPVAVSD